jgi:hypothetical protein
MFQELVPILTTVDLPRALDGNRVIVASRG